MKAVTSPSSFQRIDVLVKTPQLIAEIQRATAAFRVIDTVEPGEIEICGYTPTVQDLFTPMVWQKRLPDGSIKRVELASTPPWRHGDDKVQQ